MFLHLAVLPGADASYSQEVRSNRYVPPLDCPTWGRYELQPRSEGQSLCSSTGLSYLGPMRATAKKSGTMTMFLHWTVYLGPMRTTGQEVRDNHYVLPPDCPTWGRYELEPRS